jgi:N-acetylneuraminic acid mutarotase
MKQHSDKVFILSFLAILIVISPIFAPNLFCSDEGGAVCRIEWVKKADLPLPHRNGKALACGGKIFYMGGYCPETEELRETSNYEYDPENDRWTTKAKIPIGRSNFAIVSLGERIFIFGGDPLLPNSDVYFAGEDKWKVLTPLTAGRQHIDGVRIGNKIYVAGGCDKEFKATVNVYEGIFLKK